MRMKSRYPKYKKEIEQDVDKIKLYKYLIRGGLIEVTAVAAKYGTVLESEYDMYSKATFYCSLSKFIKYNEYGFRKTPEEAIEFVISKYKTIIDKSTKCLEKAQTALKDITKSI